MRLAILADIHGNLPAFEAALRHVAQHKVDQIIIAGDIVIGAPDSGDCWRLAESLACPILRGNHERYVVHSGTPLASQAWSTEQYAPLHWALAQLSEHERRAMGELPLHLRLAEAPDLFLVHASERNDYDTITAHTPEEQLPEMFPAARERFIIRAHGHVGQVRLWDNRYIVTNGSVGLPMDGNPTAQYLLLDRRKDGWHIRHQSVPYNVDSVVRRFHDTGCLAATGPIGRLFLREVVTATQQIIPFLRLYAHWSAEAPLPLDEAVNRFLNSY